MEQDHTKGRFTAQVIFVVLLTLLALSFHLLRAFGGE
jgi:hypothetical protein